MPHVLGVSMPRSGHHLLQHILANVLGSRFHYCEFYTIPDCCKSIPCIAASSVEGSPNDLFLQKSHDWNSSDPLTEPGTLRLVQYRAHVPRALSDYELYLRAHHEPDNQRTFRWFLSGQALYTVAFFHKWLRQCRSDFFVLGYEQFVSDPVRATRMFLNFAGISVDEKRIPAQVIAVVKNQAGSSQLFSHRDVHSHRYSSLPLLEEYESLIIKYCPGYYPMRYFPRDIGRSSVLEDIFTARRALRGAKLTPQAVESARICYEHDPDDPKLAQLWHRAQDLIGTLHNATDLPSGTA